MKNFVQKGNTVTVPSPGNITGGAVVVIGSLVGVAAGTVSTGQPLDIVTRGVFTLPKVEAADIAIGEAVYLHGTLITDDSDSGSRPFIGVAVTAAGNGDGSVDVLIGAGTHVTIIND